MAVGGVDAQLVDDFKVVFAPVFNIHQGVLQWCAIFTRKGIVGAKGFGGGEYIGGYNFIAQACEFSIG